MVFSAFRVARRELEVVAEAAGMTLAEVRTRIASRRRLRSGLFAPPHHVAGSAANLVRAAGR